MAATKFAFEERTAPVNWPKVCATNVRQLEKLGDVAALRGFLADVCVGDADDATSSYTFRLCVTNRTANRVPFVRPAGYNATTYELVRRAFVMWAAREFNFRRICCLMSSTSSSRGGTSE